MNNELDGLGVGRVVHYWPSASSMECTEEQEGKPLAAIVTAVGDDGVVNLNVQLGEPNVHAECVMSRKNVSHSTLEEKTPGTWAWVFAGQNTDEGPKPDKVTKAAKSTEKPE